MILLRETGVTHAEALTPATALVIDNEVVEGLSDGLGLWSVDTSEPLQHCKLVVAKWPSHVNTLAYAKQEGVRWSCALSHRQGRKHRGTSERIVRQYGHHASRVEEP